MNWELWILRFAYAGAVTTTICSVLLIIRLTVGM